MDNGKKAKEIWTAGMDHRRPRGRPIPNDQVTDILGKRNGRRWPKTECCGKIF